MKLHLLFADANGSTDGVTQAQILNHLPKSKGLADADAVIVHCVCHSKFAFNHGLNDLLGKKPIIIMDYLEYGWNFDMRKENILGRGAEYPCTSKNHDWGTLDQWVTQANPVLTFKRECKRKDVSSTVIPIDFTAEQPIPKTQSEAEFNARPLDVSYVWGYSHPDRARLHGEIFSAMGNMGINVIDHMEDMVTRQDSHYFRAKTWFTMFSPYWRRRPMAEVMAVQQQSKLAVNLPGAGVKCFRRQESPVGAVMAMQSDDLADSYDWMNGVNCIKLTRGREFVELVAAAERPDLYTIYVLGQENIRRYANPGYVRDYVLANIQKVL